MTISQFYSVPEAAKALQVHPQTLRRELRRGAITATKVGRRELISDSAILEYLERNTRHAANPTAA